MLRLSRWWLATRQPLSVWSTSDDRTCAHTPVVPHVPERMASTVTPVWTANTNRTSGNGQHQLNLCGRPTQIVSYLREWPRLIVSVWTANTNRTCVDMTNTDRTCVDMANTDSTCVDMANTDSTCVDMANTDRTCVDMANTNRICVTNLLLFEHQRNTAR